jgi:glycosyltransferase involved in cell wall biosynthesis
VLTIPDSLNPNPAVDWIRCVGRLSTPEMLAAYSTTDALVFLSHSESFGFPLVEAMWIGLPVVCADRHYARALCGDQAIYFDPDAPEALQAAIMELRERLDGGWWPDWTDRLAGIPKSWAQVAAALLGVGTRDEGGRSASVGDEQCLTRPSHE